MKNYIKIALTLLLIIGNSETGNSQGVQFEHTMTWDQIKTKAKQENKYIFIDAYATWCGPCKMMDTNTYPDGNVGRLVNKNFISVKVQVDRTERDNDYIRSWYETANDIRIQYNIRSLPSYLFFSPEGDLVHRAAGYQEPEEFLKTAELAIDSSRNITGMIKHFHAGVLPIPQVAELAIKLKRAGDIERALEVAKHYKDDYLNKLPLDSLVNRKYINFIVEFSSLVLPAENSFRVFWEKGEQIDKIMPYPIASAFIDFIILNKEINPQILKDKKPIVDTPNWKSIHLELVEKYNEHFAYRNILKAKISWHNQKEDWDNVVKYYIEKIDTEGIDTKGIAPLEINNTVYNVFFKHSCNKFALTKAIGWLERILEIYPDNYKWIDTYAGLLYKIGRTDAAIQWQQKAVSLAKSSNDTKTASSYQKIISKMINGQPTW